MNRWTSLRDLYATMGITVVTGLVVYVLAYLLTFPVPAAVIISLAFTTCLRLELDRRFEDRRRTRTDESQRS